MRAMREAWSPTMGIPREKWGETQRGSGEIPSLTSGKVHYGSTPPPKALVPKTKEEWKMIFGFDDKDAEYIMELSAQVDATKNPAAHRKALGRLEVAMARLRRERAALGAKREKLEREEQDLMKVFGWLHKWSENLPRPLRLEKCEGMRLPELMSELKSNPSDALKSGESEGGVPQLLHSLRRAQVLLIEHDWAGAIAKADLDADFCLPYDVTVFEMNIGGRSVIAHVYLEQDAPFCLLFISSERGWLRSEGIWWQNGHWEFDPEKPRVSELAKFDEIVLYVGSQIRACCIALDAEVATSAPAVRAPHLSNRGRDLTERKSYHIVSLARRSTRAAPLSAPGNTGRHPRMHFRRGHWRHFESHKTWIKWMLVGDPDLGFVDKHYKL